MMCDFSYSLEYSWISPCKGYKLGITGPETTKSPLSINVIHARSTLISSRPPLSCHLYPQNQIPMCLWPLSHPLYHNAGWLALLGLGSYSLQAVLLGFLGWVLRLMGQLGYVGP